MRMTQYWQYWCWKLGLTSSLVIVAIATTSPVQAQVTSDGTLGTQVNGSTSVPCTATCTITGGTASGGNLFHSFQDFSVQGAAIFDNATNIQNIFSRVTGSAASNINGTISANGTANVFLLNPNGILFGPNAQLNIGGSFVATTANAIQFGNQGVFMASTSQNEASLLTVNPSALFFNQLAAQTITNQSVVNPINPSIVDGDGLRVPDGKSLLLVGGDVILKGGALRTPGGRVELGGVAGTGMVGLNVDGNNLSLSFPEGVARASVSLMNGAEVNVRGRGGGSIAINAQNLNLTSGSTLRAGIAARLGSDSSKAGDIEINATGTTTLDAGSFISNAVLQGARGKGGDVYIATGSLFVTNGSQIFTGIFEQGNGNVGSVTINVGDTAAFDGVGSNRVSSGTYSQVNENAVGQGGNIKLTAGSLYLTNGAQIFAGTFGQGDAGSVTINVRNAAAFDGVGSDGTNSGAYSQVRKPATGQGGNVNLIAGSLFVTNGAVLNTSTFGQQGKNAGSVNIDVRDTAFFDGVVPDFGKVTSDLFSSGAYSRVEPEAVGNAGSVNVTAGSLLVTNGAVLSASTDGRGIAGNVNINIRETASFNGQGRFNDQPNYEFRQSSGAFSSVKRNGVGQGGSVNITAESLSVTDGAVLVASTLGQGNAGSVNVNVRNAVFFDGDGAVDSDFFFSGALSSVLTNGVGQGGDVNITAGSLLVTNGAVLTASTDGQGDAGNVNINIREAVAFDGLGSFNGKFRQSSGVFSSVKENGVGQGGNINITARLLSVTDGAALVTSTLGQGDAGNIWVDADLVTLSEIGQDGFSSGLFTTTEPQSEGQGGEIIVNTRILLVKAGAVINAQTRNARDGGSITINANTFEATNGGQVLTTTRSSGNAGKISFNILESVTLSDSDPNFVERPTLLGSTLLGPNVEGPASGIFANTAINSTGNGGTISINPINNPIKLTITDGAGIAVNSQGQGNAGNLQIQAGRVTLDREAFLSAETASGEGGNITLQVQDLLLMRRNSPISATARGTGDGGNININAGFVVAVPNENSDIIARAIQGRGGNIGITTQGIYGLQFSEQLTPRSDISASSDFGVDGTVNIDTPGIDPSRGLANLPTVSTEPPIAVGCRAGGRRESSEFVVTGRGGLPPNPSEPLGSDLVESDEVVFTPGSVSSANSNRAKPEPIVEAQALVRGPNGELLLVAEAPQPNLDSFWQPFFTCRALQTSKEPQP
jgi:filamentous hemagglutinin family protein